MHRIRAILILSLAGHSGVVACSSKDHSADGGGSTGGAESAGASAYGGSNAGGTNGAQGGNTAAGIGGGNAGTSPIQNPSFETPSTNGSPWISGADQWIASGNATRVTNLPNLTT